MRRLLLVAALLGGASIWAGPVEASEPPVDPTTVECPAGTGPFDGTDACACETDAAVVLGEWTPDGFVFYEDACPAPSEGPSHQPETEVMSEGVTAPVVASPAPVVQAQPGFTG